MSRQRRKIQKAVEESDGIVTLLVWEPIHAGAEKQGLAGGWCVKADLPSGPDHALGYNADEVVAWIERFWAK